MYISAKFCAGSGFGEKLNTTEKVNTWIDGSITCDAGLEIGNEFYLTVVYNTFELVNNTDEDYDFMKENQCDKILFYLDGKELGYSFLKNENFKNGHHL